MKETYRSSSNNLIREVTDLTKIVHPDFGYTEFVLFVQFKESKGENNSLFKLIREHGLARELPLIISTIRAFSQGKIRIARDKQVVSADGKPINGYNLTDEINEKVKGAL